MYDYNCDVKLVVGNETFKAHREVLENASDYFSAMFSHDMQEKDTNIIELKQISPLGFAAMIEYFYHGYVTIDIQNIEGVLEASRFFHIDWLIGICCHYLILHLSIEDYQAVLQLADTYAMDVADIQNKIFAYFCNEFLRLSAKPKFLRIQYDLLYQLLSENHCIQAPEGAVLKAVLRWLDHDQINRQQHKIELLQLIRFPILELEELDALDESILEIPKIATLVEEARQYLSVPSRQCLMDVKNTEARGSRDFLVLYSGIEDDNLISYKSSDGFGFLTEALDTSFLQVVFEFASVAVLGNFVFVAGGYGRDRWCSSPMFYRYNPHIYRWVELSSMQQPRVSFPLCSSEDGIYAVAGIDHIVLEGMDREIILDTVEFYNPEDNLWHFIPALPFGCYNVGAVVVRENLYVTGGISDDPQHDVPVNYVHVFNRQSGCWTQLESMLTERHCHGIVNRGNRLYVFGGLMRGEDTMSFNDCRLNEMYDIETNQWTSLTESPAEYGRIYSNLTIFDDKIFILGGSSKDQLYLHSFDEEKETIEEGEPCSDYVHKMVKLKVPMPAQFLHELATPVLA